MFNKFRPILWDKLDTPRESAKIKTTLEGMVLTQFVTPTKLQELHPMIYFQIADYYDQILTANWLQFKQELGIE